MLSKKFILLSLFTIFLYSCGSIRTEYWINTDQSGRTEITMDFGQMIKDMKNMLNSIPSGEPSSDSLSMGYSEEDISEVMMEEGTDAEESDYNDMGTAVPAAAYIDSTMYDGEEGIYNDDSEYDFTDSIDLEHIEEYQEPKKSSIESALDKIFDKAKSEKKIDTFFTFFDIVPDSVKSRLSKPNLLKNIKMEISVDEVKEEGKIKMISLSEDINNYQEFMQLFEEIEKIEKGADAKPNPLMDQFKNGNAFKVDVKNGLLECADTDLMAILGQQMSSTEVDEFKNMPNDQLKEMSPLLEQFNQKIIINFPRKVTNIITKLDYKMLDDDSIEFNINIMVLLKSGTIPGYSVRF